MQKHHSETSKEGLTRGILVIFASLNGRLRDTDAGQITSNVSHALQPRFGGAALPMGSARADWSMLGGRLQVQKNNLSQVTWGAGIAQWLERRTRD